MEEGKTGLFGVFLRIKYTSVLTMDCDEVVEILSAVIGTYISIDGRLSPL